MLLIAVAAATANNLVLVYLLGLGPVLDSSYRPGRVAGLTLAITLLLMLTTSLAHLLDRWVLVPYHLEYLRIIGYLVLVGAVASLADQVLRWTSERLHPETRPALRLVAIHSAVLGVALLTSGTTASLAGALALGLGAGLGFGLVLLVFAGLETRLEQAPASLRGPAIALVTLGMMSLAFLGFSGIGT
ncbi:MAG: Rnf-Nqr domain containing protein [Gammaproteobacteria bacterium]